MKKQKSALIEPVLLHKGQEAQLKALLKSLKLPHKDVAITAEQCYWGVFSPEKVMVAAVGLECYGEVALLRSLCVVPALQRSGVGRQLLAAVETFGRENAISCFYLLTETAERFFNDQGYRVIERSQAPPAIAATGEFLGICPSGAVCMFKRID